jgi:hypothetical protein
MAPNPRSRPRTKRRQEEAPQVKVVISRQAKVWLERVSERTGLPQNLVMDQVLREAQKLEREVNELGLEHVGEALAELRVLRRVLDGKKGER